MFDAGCQKTARKAGTDLWLNRAKTVPFSLIAAGLGKNLRQLAVPFFDRAESPVVMGNYAMKTGE
ncbi:MAG: hypothetical protein QM617_10630 [Comamonas sp.]